jgi:predicted oxidoreductase
MNLGHFHESLTNRLQSEHPTPARVDRRPRRVVAGVPVHVAGNRDTAVTEQVGDRFDVHAGFKPADRD